MNERAQLNADYVRTLMEQRARAACRPTAVPPARRTTRKVLATGLHRLADRLDGS